MPRASHGSVTLGHVRRRLSFRHLRRTNMQATTNVARAPAVVRASECKPCRRCLDSGRFALQFSVEIKDGSTELRGASVKCSMRNSNSIVAFSGSVIRL